MTKAEQQARIDELEVKVSELTASDDKLRERVIKAEDAVSRMRSAIDALVRILGDH